MKNWETLPLIPNGDLSHTISVVACWLLFFVPLFAVVKSFKLSKGDEVTSGTRIDLFVRHSSMWLDALLSWVFHFRADQDGRFYQNEDGVITLSPIGQKSSFKLNGHAFEYGEGSRNPEIDLLENGGVLAEGVSYKITYDHSGRIIQISVCHEEWYRLRMRSHRMDFNPSREIEAGVLAVESEYPVSL